MSLIVIALLSVASFFTGYEVGGYVREHSCEKSRRNVEACVLRGDPQDTCIFVYLPKSCQREEE